MIVIKAIADGKTESTYLVYSIRMSFASPPVVDWGLGVRVKHALRQAGVMVAVHSSFGSGWEFGESLNSG